MISQKRRERNQDENMSKDLKKMRWQLLFGVTGEIDKKKKVK